MSASAGLPASKAPAPASDKPQSRTAASRSARPRRKATSPQATAAEAASAAMMLRVGVAAATGSAHGRSPASFASTAFGITSRWVGSLASSTTTRASGLDRCGGTAAGISSAGARSARTGVDKKRQVAAIAAASICGAPAPFNDACASATSVTVGSTPFSLLGATLDGPTVTGCGSAATSTDIWFAWVPTTNGETEISTCGSGFDTRLQVFRGGCGAARTSVACNDDSAFCSPSTKASRLSFIAECGVEYLIRVGGVAGATGFGTLVVGEPNGFPCCRTDLDGSAEVDVGDIMFVLLDFGPCFACSSDIDGSGTVDLGDVAMVLLDFGPCS